MRAGGYRQKPWRSPGVQAERRAVGPAFADHALVSESFLQASAFPPAQQENDGHRGTSDTDCCNEALHGEQKCNPATRRQAQIGPVQRRRLPDSGGLVPTRARGSRTKHLHDDLQTEGIPMTNERLRRSVYEKPDALERELDKALEDSFPASDPIAIDSAEVHEERRRKAQQDSRSPFLPRSGVPK